MPEAGTQSWAASCCLGESQERLLHAAFHAQLILPDGDPRATHLEAASPLQLDNAPHTHARYATHSISAIYVCGQLENKHQGLFPFKRLGILSNQISKGR